jgi:hypothetical protein
MRYQDNEDDDIILSPLLPIKLDPAGLPDVATPSESENKLPSIATPSESENKLPSIATPGDKTGAPNLPEVKALEGVQAIMPEALKPPEINIGNAAASVADGPTDNRTRGAEGPVASAQLPQPASNPEQMMKALKATLYRDQYESGLVGHDTRVGSILT